MLSFKRTWQRWTRPDLSPTISVTSLLTPEGPRAYVECLDGPPVILVSEEAVTSGWFRDGVFGYRFVGQESWSLNYLYVRPLPWWLVYCAARWLRRSTWAVEARLIMKGWVHFCQSPAEVLRHQCLRLGTYEACKRKEKRHELA